LIGHQVLKKKIELNFFEHFVKNKNKLNLRQLIKLKLRDIN